MGIRCFIACLFLLLVAHQHCAAQEATSPVQPAYTTGFVPGTNTVFSDDFTRYKNGMFSSAKWNPTDAKIALDTDGSNILVFTVEMRTLVPVIYDKHARGKYVTFECDFRFLNNNRNTDLFLDFPDAKDIAHYFTVDKNWLTHYVRGNYTLGGNYTIPIKNKYDGTFDPMQWHCLAFSFSEKYLQVFLDNNLIWRLGSNRKEMVEDGTIGSDSTYWDSTFLYDGYMPVSFLLSNKSYVAFRSVRFAQSNEVPKGDKVQMAQFNKILTGEKFVTQDIHFEVNKADIKNESLPYLDALAAWLKQNPTIKLEIAGHTDCDGDEATNMTLSQKRADAIVNKLNSAGIADSRLKGVGYGESKPVKSNDTEAGKAANRRVEFRKM